MNRNARILLAAISLSAVFPVRAELFGYDRESGVIKASSGDSLAYDLFIPQPDAGRPAPPYPAVILTHGFARDKRYHGANAGYLAERGIIVLTPNMSGLFGGAPDQLRNIANTQAHVGWLIGRSRSAGDAMEGLVDETRIGLAGHSAGGAVSFEAALGLQNTVFPASALCLLDAVPWPRTTQTAHLLSEVSLCSLRSDPSACNSYGSVLGLLDRLTFPVLDVYIVGATHVDPENPTDLLASLACGGTSDRRRAIYQRLMYLFFQDAFGMESVEPESVSYDEALASLASDGDVRVATKGSDGPITVTSPAAGAVWIMGRTYALTWTAKSIAGDVDILASAGGGHWVKLAESVPNSGSFNIRVENGPYDAVRVRVASAENPAVSGESGVFSVIEMRAAFDDILRVIGSARNRAPGGGLRQFRR